MSQEKSPDGATSRALRYLAYRARSETEVRGYLQGNYPRPVVESAIQRLKEQGLVDDRAFAHAWSESRVSHKPRSAALVRRELLGKGVDPETAQEAVETLDDEECAYSAGLRAAQSLSGADHATFRRRVWGYLYRRGFSQAVIRRTVRRLWEER